MTKKEEKAMLLFSFVMLFLVVLTAAVGMYLQSGTADVELQVSMNDSGQDVLKRAEKEQEPEKSYQELYYLAGEGMLSGTVKDANEQHPECFVILECNAGFSGGEKTADEGKNENGAEEIWIYYNDDFVIPEYDSRMLALDLHGFFGNRLSCASVHVAFSEDEILKEAMMPAVRIVTNIGESGIKPLLLDSMAAIFTETGE